MAENADGSVAIDVNLNIDEAERKFKRLQNSIETLERNISLKKTQREPILEQFNEITTRLEAAKIKLEEMRNAASGVFSSSDIENQKETVNALQTEWNRLAKQVESYDKAIQKAETELAQNKETAGALAKELALASDNSNLLAPALDKASDSAKAFEKRIAGLIKRVFVFSLITTALRSMRTWLDKVIKSNSEASSAIARLKGALLTLAQPILNVIVPAFTLLVNVLTRFISAIAGFTSKLFGTTKSEAAGAAKSLYEEMNAIESTGEAAEEAAGSLAGFDEINTITTETSGGGTASTAADEIIPDFDFDTFDVDSYKDKIDEFTVYISGALLALGAILTFSGANIPLGIALMALGAIGLADEIEENWNAMDGEVRDAINKVLLTLGTAGLVIGAILAFSGANIPLGIGLMAFGATALGAAVALNWDEMSETLQDVITDALIATGALLLTIGAVLAFSGANIPLGIGLMALGAISLGAAAALNWDELSSNIDEIVTVIATILGAGLVVGAILAFSAGNIALGIGLMIAGAASLGTAAAINWDFISDKLKDKVGLITAIATGALLALGLIFTFAVPGHLGLGIGLLVAGAVGLVATLNLNWDWLTTQMRGKVGIITALASGALLALGLMLVLAGVNIPLGIALIAAGAAGLVTVAAINWDAILNKLKEAWKSIKDWWNSSVSKYFTVSFWQDKFSSISDALESKIKDGINLAIAWMNKFISWVNEKLNISWDSVSILGKEIIPAGNVQLLKIPSIPMLAQGTVVPPNREFLAMLGDNKTETEVVSPLSTIKQALVEAMRESGAANGSGSATIIINLDGKEIARNTVKHINNMTTMTGKPVLVY